MNGGWGGGCELKCVPSKMLKKKPSLKSSMGLYYMLISFKVFFYNLKKSKKKHVWRAVFFILFIFTDFIHYF